jgi:acetyltransferase-like isoleucine patch superfamily enzyme
MKKSINNILYKILSLSYNISNNDIKKISLRRIIVVFLHQKIFSKNRKVPWPVDRTSIFKCVEKIKRGSRFPGLSPYCYLDARNGIEIGENVWIGPFVKIISMNHDSLNFNEYLIDEGIIIGSNSWIGTNSIILPGVKLQEHTVVAAGSIVTKSFDEKNILIGGVPAKKIKKIDSYKND